MHFENQSTKCPKCKNDLTWKSHEKIWTKEREVHQFTFRCSSCNLGYLFKDDKTFEKILISKAPEPLPTKTLREYANA
jgi:uncharacterized protein with PIN domain